MANLKKVGKVRSDQYQYYFSDNTCINWVDHMLTSPLQLSFFLGFYNFKISKICDNCKSHILIVIIILVNFCLVLCFFLG